MVSGPAAVSPHLALAVFRTFPDVLLLHSTPLDPDFRLTNLEKPKELQISSFSFKQEPSMLQSKGQTQMVGIFNTVVSKIPPRQGLFGIEVAPRPQRRHMPQAGPFQFRENLPGRAKPQKKCEIGILSSLPLISPFYPSYGFR